MKNICTVDGCERVIHGKGLCSLHYARFKKYGDPLYNKIKRIHSDACSVKGCNKKFYAKDYCKAHYEKNNLYGNPLHVEKEQHGMSHTSEYQTWASMFQRCYNPNSDKYHRYGGRGITICDRWRKGFIYFFEDMGLKPFPEAQLDREKNDLGYNKDNCRWVTSKANSRNRSTGKLTQKDVNEIRTLHKNKVYYKIIAQKYGIKDQTVFDVVAKRRWN